jgi:subtilisin family serine protease
LTELGRKGRLRQNLNFEQEATRLIEVLGNGGKRNPVIVDQNGTYRDIIVEQLAIQIAQGTVPDSLKNKVVVKLETPVLFSNARSDGDVRVKVDAVLDHAIASHRSVILFIDELTQFVGTSRENSKFREALENGSLQVIGGSSEAAYAEYIETSKTLNALFERIDVRALDLPDRSTAANKKLNDDEFRGDNVSPDLREMMSQDPTGAKRVDTILQARDADNAALRTLLANGSARITGRIGNSDTLIVNLPLSSLQSLSASGLINYVSPDRQTAATGFVEDTTGAAQMRSQPAMDPRPAYTLDGSGVGVAILDSGIYSSHNGFKNGSTSRIAANVGFTGASANQTNDDFGHGTHVAGLAIGSSTYNSNAYRGIASNARIVSVKVLGDDGTGQTSWLLNGMNWVLQNRAAYNIRVVNLSMSAPAVDTYTNDPVCRMVKDLVNNGIVVVVAAGNAGKDASGRKIYGRIGSPGISPYAITVGASNGFGTVSHSDDAVTSYSSRGPTRSYYVNSAGTRIYDNIAKPDLVSPGNKLISYAAMNNAIADANPQLVVNPLSNKNDRMMYLSGTSTSAPLVAGAAALLMQVNPNLTPAMVKMLLEYSAQPIAGADMFEQGAGQLNIDGAVRIARRFRTDMDFQASGFNGAPLLPSDWTPRVRISSRSSRTCTSEPIFSKPE